MRAPNVPRCVGRGVSVAVHTRAPVFALTRPMCACHSVWSTWSRLVLWPRGKRWRVLLMCNTTPPTTRNLVPGTLAPKYLKGKRTNAAKARRTAEKPRTPTGTLNIVYRVCVFLAWRSRSKRLRGLERCRSWLLASHRTPPPPRLCTNHLRDTTHPTT